MKVYRENVSTASYDTSQYCVSFTDQTSIFDDYESQPQSNTTAMYTDMMQDPDMIQEQDEVQENASKIKTVDACDAAFEFNLDDSNSDIDVSDEDSFDGNKIENEIDVLLR